MSAAPLWGASLLPRGAILATAATLRNWLGVAFLDYTNVLALPGMKNSFFMLKWNNSNEEKCDIDIYTFSFGFMDILSNS